MSIQNQEPNNLDAARQYAQSARNRYGSYVTDHGEHHRADAEHAATMASIHAAIAQAEALQRIADILAKTTATTYDGTRSALNVHVDQ